MKNKAGLIVPLVMILFGIYALSVSLSSSGEQVILISDHQIPRGLGMIFGLLGLGGGIIVILSTLSNKKYTA